LPHNSKRAAEGRSDFGLSRSGHNARLDDFLRLDAVQDNGDAELDEQKDRETGLLDIHLEDPRDDPATLYLQIYGVSERWLTLLSQTTRLANVVDTIRFSGKAKSIHLMNSLERRKERLENMICAFASTTPAAQTSAQSNYLNEEGTTSQLEPIESMTRALNAALVIFFYRRIRNVNPWILQAYVDDVIQALQDFDAALSARKIEGPGTPWPAFIAGCEALTEARRAKFRQWIERGYGACGYAIFKTALETMIEVWKKRDGVAPDRRSTTSSGHGDGTAMATSRDSTWMDVSREKRLWLMLG